MRCTRPNPDPLHPPQPGTCERAGAYLAGHTLALTVLYVPYSLDSRFHFETLMVCKLSSKKSTTQNDLCEYY